LCVLSDVVYLDASGGVLVADTFKHHVRFATDDQVCIVLCFEGGVYMNAAICAALAAICMLLPIGFVYLFCSAPF
jgi:hypothetical protein